MDRYEAAARRYCEILGLDPDADGECVALTSAGHTFNRMWESFVGQMRIFDQQLQALRETAP